MSTMHSTDCLCGSCCQAEPPWDELDEGICSLVRLLWLAGFDPIDSGDGSKAAWMEGALGVPHVFMRASRHGAAEQHTRLIKVLTRHGIEARVQFCIVDSGEAILEAYPFVAPEAQ